MTIPTKTQAKCPSVLAKHADTIRQLSKQTVENIIEIGRRLVDCRDNHLEHGEWLPWLQREFGWSDRTALNFIRVYEQSKSENFSDLNLPVSSLYLLAAPSTPETAKSEIIKRAKTGTPVSVAEVKQTINAAKARRAAEATGKALPVAKRVGADGKARKKPKPKPAAAPTSNGGTVHRDIEAAVAVLNLFVTDPAAWQQRMAKAGTEGKRKIANSYRELAKRCMAAAQALDDEIESAQGNGSDPEASAGKRKAAYALDAGSDPGPIPECPRRDRVS
jgi:hypothetical protein